MVSFTITMAHGELPDSDDQQSVDEPYIKRSSSVEDDNGSYLADDSHASLNDYDTYETHKSTPAPEDLRLVWFADVARRLLDGDSQGSSSAPIFDPESKETLLLYLDTRSECQEVLLFTQYEAEIENVRTVRKRKYRKQKPQFKIIFS